MTVDGTSSLKKEGTELMSISPTLPNPKIDTVESSLSRDAISNSPNFSHTAQTTEKLSPSPSSSENKSISNLMRLKPWHSSPCLSDTLRPTNSNQDSSEKHKYLNVPESKTEPSSPAISAYSRLEKKSPYVSPTNLLKSISVLRIDYKELQKNEPLTNESSRTGLKLKSKSSKTKSLMTDCIVMHDVPKSESLLIKSDNSISDTPLVNSTSCSSSSLTCNESFMASESKNARLIPSARRRRKESPKLLSVPHSIWEETDEVMAEAKAKSSGGGRLKRVSSSPLVRSLPALALEKQHWNVARKKSFIEDGGSSIQPMSTKFFPRPTQGQSLASFLSSSQFTRANAELDRENAHFSISEAIISAIEQVKCNQLLGLVEENAYESDEEINSLKQRIRLRRRQKQEERRRTLIGITLLSDGKTDTTTTTDQSASPLSSSLGDSSDSLSTDDVDDLELDQVTSSNLDDLSKSGLSMSMASLYSEAEISRCSGGAGAGAENVVSAEAVALSLLSQFSDKQLPRASDIEWLVSEKDAPQQLLPLPRSWPVSPDEAEDQDMRQATLLRGTTDWAPPRPQVIFTLHPSPVRRVLMTKQNYRCAGCGMKVVPDYAHKYRYCEYLGRFFCTGCHMNQQAIIPGRVLSKWDFAKYPVSSFSYRLLDQMFSDPLFNIEDHSPNLYRRVRCLEKIRTLRLQLFYLKDFLLTCRFAHDLAKSLESEPPYILMEPDVYSLQDLISSKSGELGERLKELVSNATAHVKSCQLCQVRGFVCEVCRSQEVIYPWELERVVRCMKCGSCFHSNCYSPKLDCPRCLRILQRAASSVQRQQQQHTK
ncbi:run domain Beclin-1-interacting and cysteine-rich domain-containing protein isoform X2 [Nilaparvata lugens]|nr:run domain Beclin-1-interacting and cysteine-rich domain-containing protein isoform X2 [Nilaparvata lugens]